MTILCGTDFSEQARVATEAAAYLAKQRKTNLCLVHVLDIPGADEVLAAHTETRVSAFFEAEEARLKALLQAEAQRLAGIGVKLEFVLLTGRADEAVTKYAHQHGIEWIVVSAVGRRGERLTRLGSTSDRIAQTAGVPVLVARNAAPFREWSAGVRALRLVVGIDLSTSADAALRWVETLTASGPCEVTAVHVYWPPDLRDRVAGRSLAIGEGNPDAERELEAGLRTRLAQVTSDMRVALRIVGGLGRPADHLVQIASAEQADLLVVGTHQRRGLDRIWHGSFSRDTIFHATASVAVVPAV
jgi:nucleotide-binding universal stress UspA family protein